MSTWAKFVVALLSLAILATGGFIALMLQQDGAASAASADTTVSTPQAPGDGSPQSADQGGLGLPTIPNPAELGLPNVQIPTLGGPSGDNPATVAWGPDILPVSLSDLDRTSQYSYDPNDPYCVRTPLVTDSLQSVAFQITNQLRTGLSITDAEEIRIGNELHAEMINDPTSMFYGRTDRNPALAAYVRAVAEPFLAYVDRPGIPYTFHIVEDPEPNAFAIPGGHIYVMTGLLQNRGRMINEAQLAGVLAHELAHVDLRHSTAAFEVLAQGDTVITREDLQVILNLVEMPYSAEYEDEADRYAVQRLFQTQYSPYQFELMFRMWDSADSPAGDPLAQVLGQFEQELNNLLGSHSDSGVRACNVRNEIARWVATYPHDRFYIGTNNLNLSRARSVQTF